MSILDRLGYREEDAVWLAPELYRRAAQCFERAQAWQEAAECWAEVGEGERAAALYLRLDDPVHAAPLLLAAGQYAQAENAYRAWLAGLGAGDVLGEVTARLGLAACCLALGGRRAELLAHYRRARALLEEEEGREALTAGRCWEALGLYGVRIGRLDLVQVGYEQALRRYGEEHNRERVRAGRAYLAGVEGVNLLLAADVEARLLAWDPTLSGRALREWEEWREEIEAGGFRGGVRDVLHLADEKGQLAAWWKLAAIEGDPEQAAIEAYLRGLAPEGMVYVPAGVFLMGTTEEEIADLLEHTTNETLRMLLETEKPQHEVWLPGYYVGRCPVTNAEFAAFVVAAGYRTEAEGGGGGWVVRGGSWQQMEGADWRHPDGPESGITGKDDHPVVQVSWNDAQAYCAWAGARLPTEAEWEKAASWDPNPSPPRAGGIEGGRKRRYPWGDEWDAARCHINRPDEGTAPVGTYSPRGDSACGCADMTGDVGQWCSTRWGTATNQPDYRYPYDPADGREDPGGGREMLRIARGTSWHTVVEPVAQWARCAYRLWDYPWDWVSDLWGFRMAAPRRLPASES